MTLTIPGPAGEELPSGLLLSASHGLVCVMSWLPGLQLALDRLLSGLRKARGKEPVNSVPPCSSAGMSRMRRPADLRSRTLSHYLSPATRLRHHSQDGLTLRMMMKAPLTIPSWCK